MTSSKEPFYNTANTLNSKNLHLAILLGILGLALTASDSLFFNAFNNIAHSCFPVAIILCMIKPLVSYLLLWGTNYYAREYVTKDLQKSKETADYVCAAISGAFCLAAVASLVVSVGNMKHYDDLANASANSRNGMHIRDPMYRSLIRQEDYYSLSSVHTIGCTITSSMNIFSSVLTGLGELFLRNRGHNPIPAK